MPPTRTVTLQESRFVRTLSVFVVLALILELVGLAGPGWIVMAADAGLEIKVYVGIWFAIVCVGGKCEVESNYHSTLDFSK